MAIVGQRRLQFSERIISAASVACDQGHYETAKRLLLAAEDALRQTPFDRSRKYREVHEALALVHAKRWEAEAASLETGKTPQPWTGTERRRAPTDHDCLAEEGCGSGS